MSRYDLPPDHVLLEMLAARRADAEFMARLQTRLAEDAPVLDRLRDDDDLPTPDELRVMHPELGLDRDAKAALLFGRWVGRVGLALVAALALGILVWAVESVWRAVL